MPKHEISCQNTKFAVCVGSSHWTESPVLFKISREVLRAFICKPRCCFLHGKTLPQALLRQRHSLLRQPFFWSRVQRPLKVKLKCTCRNAADFCHASYRPFSLPGYRKPVVDVFQTSIHTIAGSFNVISIWQCGHLSFSPIACGGNSMCPLQK